MVTNFLAAGVPLVSRRQPESEGESSIRWRFIAVGMPLPPSQGKLRVPLVAPLESIMLTRPPLELAEVIPHLPQRWRAPLRDLLRSAEAVGIQFRVYGSAAWEALTGQSYLASRSDIDLLWQPAKIAQIDAGIRLLEAWEAQSGLVADGEIEFGDDAAVAWREWKSSAQRQPPSHRVLVKTFHGPRLSARSELLGLIAPRAYSTRTGLRLKLGSDRRGTP
jgi:phosphoribosyl-dephospho-CoA transferase